MSSNSSIKIVFIINPISGVGRQKVIEKLIERQLSDDNYDISIRYTEGAKHAIQISREEAPKNDIVVAVGGDGSVNEIARGLINSDCKLAIIPTGSGNGLARHLKIPMNLSKALDRIKTGSTLKIDSVQINNDFFFCTAGAGFDAHVGWKFAQAKKRGFWSYTKIVLKSVFSYQPTPLTIKVDSQEHHFDKPMIATCANANQFGNNVIISPRSVINDGYIRFIEIDKFPVYYYPAFTYYLLTKKLYNFKYYFEVKAKEITIFISNEEIHIDGEPVKLGKTLNIKVLPNSLNVIV